MPLLAGYLAVCRSLMNEPPRVKWVSVSLRHSSSHSMLLYPIACGDYGLVSQNSGEGGDEKGGWWHSWKVIWRPAYSGLQSLIKIYGGKCQRWWTFESFCERRRGGGGNWFKMNMTWSACIQVNELDPIGTIILFVFFSITAPVSGDHSSLLRDLWLKTCLRRTFLISAWKLKYMDERDDLL